MYFRVTGKWQLKLLAELTHPPDLASRNAHHQRIIRNVPVDNRPCADERGYEHVDVGSG